jgi:hypothetical protein
MTILNFSAILDHNPLKKGCPAVVSPMENFVPGNFQNSNFDAKVSKERKFSFRMDHWQLV